MSLSKLKSKIPIAKDKDDKSLVYYHPEKGIAHLISQKGYLPYHHGDSVGYVVGRRGCGKTTFCNLYMKSYVKATKGRVFLISRLEEDPSIDLPERSMRISPDDISEIDMPDLENSLVIIDDITDAKLTKLQQNDLYNFVLDIIENSRHHNISCLITSHLPTNYAKTRAILNECSFVTIFPQYSNRYQIERMLKTYFGFKQREVNEFFSKPSRWIQISTTMPKYILTENEVYLY